MKLDRFYSSLSVLQFSEEWEKWDVRFLKLAKEVSTWSKDPSTQVGAVLVNGNNNICGIGYNGFPKRICDDNRLSNRDRKYEIVIHAEENAIFNSSYSDWSTVYTYPFPPCVHCASRLIQAGRLDTVVSVVGWPERWDDSISKAFNLFREAGVELRMYNQEVY